jgi:hypothetical protein
MSDSLQNLTAMLVGSKTRLFEKSRVFSGTLNLEEL